MIDTSAAGDAYITAALWSCVDDDGNPLDARFGPDDLAPETQAFMRQDVEDFINDCEAVRPDAFDGITAGQLGHDLLLTRNYHGVGFWARGLGERGDWLTKMAHSRGECELVVGDDGRLWTE